MNKEAYKERLRQFNSTPKYKNELNFLTKLMEPALNEKILDYGCGLGTCVKYFQNYTGADCYGYDIKNYRDEETDNAFYFRSEYFFKFDKVYFMHSIAHLPDTQQKLQDLKALLNPTAKIYVITPNKDWIINVPKINYIPDPTVIKHFALHELKNLFIENGFDVSNGGQFGDMVPTLGAEILNERLFLEAQWSGK